MRRWVAGLIVLIVIGGLLVLRAPRRWDGNWANPAKEKEKSSVAATAG